MEKENAYYRRRAEEERQAALASKSINARFAHLELASLYAEAADAMEAVVTSSSQTEELRQWRRAGS